MKIQIKSKSLIYNIFFLICLLYLLMRPFLNTYVTESIKYIFIIVIIYCAACAILNKKIISRIGNLELFFFFLFWIYAVLNAFIFGGSELLLYTIERYLFYSIPFFVMPIIMYKTNWIFVFKFLSIFGIIDASVSIIEFITHKQMFPMGVEHNIVQLYGDNSIRTFGLNGNYFLLAEILCICGLAAFYLYKFQKSKLGLVAFLIISVGILTTGSRGYYVAYLVGLLVLYLMDGKHKGISIKQLIKIILIITFAIIGLYVILMTDLTIGNEYIDTVLTRIRSIFDWKTNKANVVRVQHWSNAIESWKSHFWFGSGACSTDTRYSKFLFVTESGILKRLVEMGIVGTILQYLTMFIPLSKGINNYKKEYGDNQLMIYFFSIIVMLLCEDIILQQYTSIEYTVFIWLALSYIMNYRKDINSK